MRKWIRGWLMLMLLVAAGFAAWAWLRPYAWSVDPGARCRVVGCEVKRDRSNYWLDVHLKVVAEEGHDLAKPVELRVAGGRGHEPADLTVRQDDGGVARELWLKFWLDARDFDGPVELALNDGVLSIRSGAGVPGLADREARYWTTNGW